MPSNITDVDEFTDPVQYPIDGEAANGNAFAVAPQDLANRTRNNKNRIDVVQTHAAYVSQAVALTASSGAFVQWTEEINASGFVLAGNEIQVAAAGTYQIILTGGLQTSAGWGGTPKLLGVNLNTELAVLQFCRTWNVGTTSALLMPIAGHKTIVIATPASEKIRVVEASTENITPQLNLSIRRVA